MLWFPNHGFFLKIKGLLESYGQASDRPVKKNTSWSLIYVFWFTTHIRVIIILHAHKLDSGRLGTQIVYSKYIVFSWFWTCARLQVKTGSYSSTLFSQGVSTLSVNQCSPKVFWVSHLDFRVSAGFLLHNGAYMHHSFSTNWTFFGKNCK